MKKYISKLKNRKTLSLIPLVFFLALILRSYKIAEFPAGLNADEAAIGYNAYSLLETGKDEFGHSWPITFQSFNDFKPGLYFYLVLPFVKIFGLNELAVRLPSAILGTLTVLAVYFLVKELFLDGFTRIGRQIYADTIALIAALLLAISPWHLHFSRGGWETNAATFFITLGFCLFFKAFKNPKFYLLSSIFWLLALYTYHSARVIVPVLVLGLGFVYRKKIFKKQNFSWLFMAVLAGVVLITPLAVSFFGSAGVSRFSGVGIFADTGPIWRINELRGQHLNPFSLFPKLLHNKVIGYGINFLENYLSHFSGDFLFISGDEIQRNKVPEMGQLYLLEIFFLPLGIYFLIKNKPKNWFVPLWWLVVAPIASSLTFQSPHALRALNMVVPLTIINAYGICNLVILIKQTFSSKILFTFYFLLFTFYLWNLGYYLHQYYVHYPKRYPAAWEYGFRELVDYVKNNQENYEKIYVTNKYDQPYILLAFFLKYPPGQFQKEAQLSERDQYGFSTVEHFGKYYFRPINWESLKNEGKVLIVGTAEEIPGDAKIIKKIYFKDEITEAFRITEL